MSTSINATPHQLAMIAIIPKFTAGISILMSSLVVATILRDEPRYRKIYHRLVLGLSAADIIGSLSMFLTTWLIPKNTTDYEVAFNYGNDATCRFHAFTSQLVITTPLYNTSLSLYFLFVIYFGWNDETLRRWEPFLHAVPWLWGVATATATASLGLHGVTEPLCCWIDSKYIVYQWIFMFGPVNLCVIMVAVINLIIYRHVRTIEQRNERYNFQQQQQQQRGDAENGAASGHNTSRRRSMQAAFSFRASSTTARAQGLHRNRSRVVAGQCFWFAGAFFLNWFPYSVGPLLHVSFAFSVGVLTTCGAYQVGLFVDTLTDFYFYPLFVVGAATVTIQGLPNALVYFRPKYLAFRKERHTRWLAMQKAISKSMESQPGSSDSL